jgi:serine/threonine protein phosphatase PrpC
MANVGDSRAVLAKRTPSGYQAKRISVDHKPNLPEEKSRIESKNGEVKKLAMDIPYRLFLKGREFPGISMSRAIGDTIAQSIGLISDPAVMCIDLEDEDEFILICSDGVWEFIEDQEAVEIIKPVDGNVKQGADRLATLAWSRWIQNEVDVVDDITVVACYLKGNYVQSLRLNKV